MMSKQKCVTEHLFEIMNSIKAPSVIMKYVSYDKCFYKQQGGCCYMCLQH